MRAEHGAVVLLDDAGEALDDADRRAQVVRDQRAELGVLDRPRRGRGRAAARAAAQQPPGAGRAGGGGRDEAQGDRQDVAGAGQHGGVALRVRSVAFATRAGRAATTRDIDNDCRQRPSPARFKSGRFAPKMRRTARTAHPRRPAVPTRAMSLTIEKVTA